MSGGVDSSVAAALLLEAGHELIGVTAIMTAGPSRCCSDEDVRTAQRVAAQLGIPHEVVSVQEDFDRDIIQYFGREYLAGRTPSPCVLCNPRIKFGRLLEEAMRLGAERMATGHYAWTKEDSGGGVHLQRGVDAHKDQSYFLARLNQRQLASAAFPLGQLTKPEVVRLATQKGLASRASRESQELCFVGDAGHGTWIDVRWLTAPGRGDILDRDGRKVGEHDGIHHYTIGQRRGLGLAVGRPVYVTAIDAARNVIVVGDYAETLGRVLTATDVNWIAGRPPAARFRASVQIRYHHAAAEAEVSLAADGSAGVEFAEPQFAIAPGQQAAFYLGDELLGGGWIGAGQK